MHKKTDRRRIRTAFSVFLICAIVISDSLLGYFGLQSHNKYLTLFSASIFGIGMIALLVSLIHPFKWNRFWFSYILERLGRIELFRKFGISQHAEGAINLSLLLASWSIFLWLIVGGESYLFNDATTLLFNIFTYSWLFFSIHLHYDSLTNLSNLSKIVKDNQKASFDNKTKAMIKSFNKISAGLLILGLVLFAAVATFYIDLQEDAQSRLTFYVETPWNGTPTFAMAYPPTTLPHYVNRVTSGLTYGIIGVISGLVLITTILLLWLASDKIQATVDIYDPNCLKPAERLLNTFWLLTGAGLLLVPFMTAFSLNLQAAGNPLTARWTNYISGTYIIFFVGILVFSMTKYFIFVSSAKNPVEQQIRKELKDALEAKKVDRDKVAAARMKMRLLSSFKSRPTLSTLLQLIQIVAIILLNVLVETLG